MAVQKEFTGTIHYGDPAKVGGLSVFSKEFDHAYAYDGDDLGCTYTPEGTAFALWAPTAEAAEVILYSTWDGAAHQTLPMSEGDKGVWRARSAGDLQGYYYNYRVKVGEDWNEAVDPYARAVGVNGDRGAILDLTTTNPERWTRMPPFHRPAVDAVIYEVHVRDLTIHPSSGAAHKGKYLGAAESGTLGPDGISTGLSHIASLGVTHVQWLPLYDYSTESVDEKAPDGTSYNWGYDPKNYNVPEGSYSTNPYDPSCRIRELKTLIQACHDQGLRVVMDVVFNHMYDGYRANLMKLVPGYYFRHEADGSLVNGSGCGNDTASERAMMRKLIVDSVLFWAREYRMDGFRFDLMGLHDVETMNEIRRRLDEMDPSILMIGEGWKLKTALPDHLKANQENAASLPRIGQFNDEMRDGLKGSVFFDTDRGWVNGNRRPEALRSVLTAITGSIDYGGAYQLKGYAQEPDQSVSYVEAHDNNTLYDKLLLTNPDDDEGTRRRMHRLASSIALTAQGIAFLHAGQEFLRTKQGVENSYRSPDTINWLDWERCAQHQDDVGHIRRLIALRREHPAFRMPTADQIREHLHVERAPDGVIAYTLRNHANGDSARHLFIIHNANRYMADVSIPLRGSWQVIFGLEVAGPFDRTGAGTVSIQALSTLILQCQEDVPGAGAPGYFV